MFTKAGQETLDFTFKNLKGKPVSIHDNRFKNKVVIPKFGNPNSGNIKKSMAKNIIRL